MAQVPKTLRGKIAKLRLGGDGPCLPARRWANGRDPRKAWANCKNGEWLMWLCEALHEQSMVGTNKAFYRRSDAFDRDVHEWITSNPMPDYPDLPTAEERMAAYEKPAAEWTAKYNAETAPIVRRHFPWRWVECRARKLGLL